MDTESLRFNVTMCDAVDEITFDFLSNFLMFLCGRESLPSICGTV